MFRVKICGITTPADAQLAIEAGADAIGLNFYPPSPRFVTAAQASEIGFASTEGVERVGVFVGTKLPEILQIADEARLSAIQLHGDETVEETAEVLRGTSLPVYLAIRCRDGAIDEIAARLTELKRIARLPDAILLDAYEPGSFGGTGRRLDWDAVRVMRDQICDLPLILAGGLNPANVSEAVAQAAPDAVDVASGVEASPGRKDPHLMQKFVASATAAFNATQSR